MQVAYINENEPDETKPKYLCNVCGLYSTWTDQHGNIERPVEYNKDDWGEEYFIICSNECRSAAREHFIKWLSGKGGWTKKTATENYDTCVIK